MTKRQKEFLQILERSMGIVTTAAANYGINPSTHYEWCKKSPEYKEAAEAARHRVDDMVESALLKAIRAGETAAIIFYCKTRLKNRGYTEKVEIEGNVTARVEDMTDEEIRAELARIRSAREKKC